MSPASPASSAPSTLSEVVVAVTGLGEALAGVATVGGALMVTLALPLVEPDEAVMVNGPPGVAPAVKRPVASTVPPPLVFQIKDAGIEPPNWSVAVALNCWVAPGLSRALEGDTAMVRVCCTVTETLLVAVSPPPSVRVAVIE